MKTVIIVFGLLLLPSLSFAAPLTQDQASSLISVVQSSPQTPANAFIGLITAFSNITMPQAESLITVVQASPGTPSRAFINFLMAFTADQPITLTTPVVSIVNQLETPNVPVMEPPTITLEGGNGIFTLIPNSPFSIVSVNVIIPDAQNVRNLSLHIGNESFGTIPYPQSGINSFTPSGGKYITATTTLIITADGISNPDVTVNVIDSTGTTVKL